MVVVVVDCNQRAKEENSVSKSSSTELLKAPHHATSAVLISSKYQWTRANSFKTLTLACLIVIVTSTSPPSSSWNFRHTHYDTESLQMPMKKSAYDPSSFPCFRSLRGTSKVRSSSSSVGTSMNNSFPTGLKSQSSFLSARDNHDVPNEQQQQQQRRYLLDQNKLGMIIGYILVAIAGVSLFGWAYIFYLRRKYKLEEEKKQNQDNGGNQSNANEKGCWKRKDKNKQAGVFQSSTPIHRQQQQRQGISGNNTSGESNEDEEEISLDILDDTLKKELEEAAKQDATREGYRKSLDAKRRTVRPITPPARDAFIPVIADFNDHPSSSVPRLDTVEGRGNGDSMQPSWFGNAKKGRRSTNNSPYPPDPDDLMLTSVSSSGGSKSDQSIENDNDHSGFEVINYVDSKNEMSAKMLNPASVGIGNGVDDDDESFGQQSGTQMSLGTDNGKNTPTNHRTPSNGPVSPLGFFTIDDELEMRHDYIPKEEYDAAVEAASLAIKGKLDNMSQPSDEELGLGFHPSDEIEAEQVHKHRQHDDDDPLNVTNDTDPALSQSTMTSDSYNDLTSEEERTNMSNESGSDNHGIFKELKNVSMFLKRYERKKSKRDLKVQEKMERQKSQRSLQVVENQITTDNKNYNAPFNNPAEQSNELQRQQDQNRDKRLKRRQRRLRKSARNNDGEEDPTDEKENGDDQNNVNAAVVAAVTGRPKHSASTAPKHLPPRPPTPTSTKGAGPTPPSSSAKNKGNIDSHISRKKKATEQISLSSSPSAESSMSEGKFLKNEIESFFQTDEPSLSNILSESGDPSTHRLSSQQSLSESMDNINTSSDTETTGTLSPEKGSMFNRLGIKPFSHGGSQQAEIDIMETVAGQSEPSLVEKPKGQDNPSVVSSAREKISSSTNKSARRETSNDVVMPPSKIRVSPRAKKNKTKLNIQNNSSSKNTVDTSLGDEDDVQQQAPSSKTSKTSTDNSDAEVSMTQAAIASLQTGTRNIASFFESKFQNENKASTSDALLESRNHSSRNFRPVSNAVSSTRHKKQHRTPPSTSHDNASLSSTKSNSVSSRGASNINGKDATPETPSQRRQVSPPIGPSDERGGGGGGDKLSTASSPRYQSGARNLISMFESRTPTPSSSSRKDIDNGSAGENSKTSTNRWGKKNVGKKNIQGDGGRSSNSSVEKKQMDSKSHHRRTNSTSSNNTYSSKQQLQSSLQQETMMISPNSTQENANIVRVQVDSNPGRNPNTISSRRTNLPGKQAQSYSRSFQQSSPKQSPQYQYPPPTSTTSRGQQRETMTKPSSADGSTPSTISTMSTTPTPKNNSAKNTSLPSPGTAFFPKKSSPKSARNLISMFETKRGDDTDGNDAPSPIFPKSAYWQ